MYQVECFVDVFQVYDMGDYWVDLDFLVYVLVDNFGYIGVFFGVVKGGVFLGLIGDQLEWLC